MYFFHSPAIWAEFPALVPGLLLVEGVTADADVAGQIAPLWARAGERLANGSEAELPEIQAWRRAFSQMGFKPTQYRSAAEALLRRFRKEDALPALHPLVDLCNAASIAYALPVAVIDINAVDRFLEVRHATGEEIYRSWSEEIEHPDVNEVIFADASNNVHARRWTFRQSRQSTVSSSTTQALVVSEGLHPTAGSDVPALIDTLQTELATAGFRVSHRSILSATSPRWQE